jgi:hypothetical protein
MLRLGAAAGDAPRPSPPPVSSRAVRVSARALVVVAAAVMAMASVAGGDAGEGEALESVQQRLRQVPLQAARLGCQCLWAQNSPVDPERLRAEKLTVALRCKNSASGRGYLRGKEIAASAVCKVHAK